MARNLYVVTGLPGLLKLSRMATARKEVDVYVQKYVAIEDGPFKQVWIKPVKCRLLVWSFCDDQVTWSKDGALANLSAKIPSISLPVDKSVIPGMEAESSTNDLLGLSMEFCYDYEHRVGIILEGEVEVKLSVFDAPKRKQVVRGVDLRIIADDQKLMSEEEMRLHGIPAEILNCPALLREASCSAWNYRA